MLQRPSCPAALPRSCCLTSRSTGPATARHPGREAAKAHHLPRGQGASPPRAGYLCVRPLNHAKSKMTNLNQLRPLIALIAVTLAGCTASSPIESEGRSITNSITRTVVSHEQLKRLRAAWSSPTQELLSKSKAPQDVQWTLDYIATIESAGVKPCFQLVLLGIHQLV